jgi:hypothetical protein
MSVTLPLLRPAATPSSAPFAAGAARASDR